VTETPYVVHFFMCRVPYVVRYVVPYVATMVPPML